MSEDVGGLNAGAFASLRRAQELVTARRLFAAELTTEGEFLSTVGRVLLEVGVEGFVELLAAQATFTSIAVETIVGPELVGEALAKVAQILVLTEGVAS